MHAADPTSLNDLYRQFLDASSNPIFCFSSDFRYVYANQAFADGIGKNLDEIVGRGLWEIFTEDEAKLRLAIVREIFDLGQAKTHEMLVRGSNGDRYYLTTVTPIFDVHGRARFVLANSTDITERKQAESVLKASEEKYRALVETTSTGYLILNREGKVVDANAEYVRLTGYSDIREILGRSVLEWTAEYEIERNAAAVAQCARDGFIRNLIIDYVDRNGRTTPIEINAKVIGGGDSVQIISLCRDITERMRMELHIRELAFHDSLTKLPNRRLLYDRLSQAMATNKRSGFYGALMFLDLDNFKPLNDAHGHEVGDLLLTEAANRLKAFVREMDTVARFGGDEFVVVLSELAADKEDSTAQASSVAEKIRIAMSEPYYLTKKRQGKPDTTITHHCSASIGVTLFISHEASPDDVLKWADAAMYQAKESGRNSIQFYDS